MIFDDTNNIIIQLKETEIRQNAKILFQEQCGAGASPEAKKNMFAAAESVRRNISDRMNIKITGCFVPADNFRDNAVYVRNERITCDFFRCIPEKNVEGICLYVVTLGNLESVTRQNEMTQVYEEIWTNSYLNASLQYMKTAVSDEIKSRIDSGRLFMSKMYGPGYYGMQIEEATAFVRAADAERIGVFVSENGVMKPGKTCTGLFFVLNSPESEAEAACVQCRGNKGGCEFCSENKKIYQKT